MKSQIDRARRNLRKGSSEMRKLTVHEGEWLVRGNTVSQALSTLPQCLPTELDPGEIAWVGGGQSEPIKARESERISYSINLQKSKASYNNNSLCISSRFHLRISESLWNSHPTMWGIIICSRSWELRDWVFCGVLLAQSSLGLCIHSTVLCSSISPSLSTSETATQL